MQCPECHDANQRGSSYCSECGTRFEQQQQLRDTKRRGRRFWVTLGVVVALIAVVVLVVIARIGSGYESRSQERERALEAQYIRIEAGSFTMGSPEGEPGRFSNEEQHRVTLTRSFEISATEVTQGQYKRVMGENPSRFQECGKNCPVEQVSWHDAVRYCNKLSEQAGLQTCYECSGKECKPKSGDTYACKGYRLPTEAEWEYAARAGTSSAYYSGEVHGDGNGKEPALDRIGWYDKNSGGKTNAVKGKAPNAWGLYDMSGNVWEWCHDWFGPYSTASATDPFGASTGMARIWRGGGWNGYARNSRSADRDNSSPDSRSGNLGFRPVRSL